MKLHYPLFFMLLATLQLAAQENLSDESVVFSGIYNGKNLYVQNPLAANGKSYCARAIFVNDEFLLDAPQASAFVINLNHIPPQTHVEIKLQHAAGCVPKLINPQVLLPASNYSFLAIAVDERELYWRSSGEKPTGKFFAEQFQNGAWQTVQALPGKGKQDEVAYRVTIHLHAGENKFRVKYLQEDGQVYYSRVVSHFSDQPPVSFSPTRVSDKIYLSSPTDYLVVNAEGRVLMKGFGKEIVCENLVSGLYYLRIENRNEKFYKK